jgi:hypothetical protein
MKIFVLTLISMVMSATYMINTIQSVAVIQQEGIVFECDSNATSDQIPIRGHITKQITVTGIDSANIIVLLLVGGRDYLPSNVNVLSVDSAKAGIYIDTITADGVYSYDSYSGTAFKFISTKKDSGIKVRYNSSTY